MLNFDCLGGYREGETPGPIPNPEAKPLIADNTAGFTCGNVGRCLVRQSITYPFISIYYFKHFSSYLYIIISTFYISQFLISIYLCDKIVTIIHIVIILSQNTNSSFIILF